MTNAKEHILEIVRHADNLTPTRLMDLHNVAMDQLKRQHEGERATWETETEALRRRLAGLEAHNGDLRRESERTQTTYFVVLLVAICVVLWALSKAGVVG